MKKIFILTGFILPFFCMAQTQLAREYSYDASGNRTSCAVIDLSPSLSPPVPPPPPDSAEDGEEPDVETHHGASLPIPQTPEYFVETLAQTEIKIYPNPTTEKITLEFVGGVETRFIASLRLFSLSGQLLQEYPVHSPTTVVSLAGLPKGVYILKVSVNGVSEEWKIIKN